MNRFIEHSKGEDAIITIDGNEDTTDWEVEFKVFDSNGDEVTDFTLTQDDAEVTKVGDGYEDYQLDLTAISSRADEGSYTYTFWKTNRPTRLIQSGHYVIKPEKQP